MKSNEIIESYREKFKAEINLLLKLNGIILKTYHFKEVKQ